MKIAILSPIAWRTPPKGYGPSEMIASLICEELVRLGHEVTLFASKDSITTAKLQAVCPQGYEENEDIKNNAKIWEQKHIANCFSSAQDFDIIHNHFNFLPLFYSQFVKTPVLTTVHSGCVEFDNKQVLDVFQQFNGNSYYCSISLAARHTSLKYVGNVYHGIDLGKYEFSKSGGDYLLFIGRFHPSKGADQAIKIAKATHKKLIMAGIVQDAEYFSDFVAPYIDNEQIIFRGPIDFKEKIQLFGGALAMLHPINFEEPFGLTVIESQACGTPVIAFDRGSMAEIILDGKTGFTVKDKGMAVRRLKDFAKIDRAKCRRWVEEKFSVQTMVKNYVEIYKDIIDK